MASWRQREGESLEEGVEEPAEAEDSQEMDQEDTSRRLNLRHPTLRRWRGTLEGIAGPYPHHRTETPSP